MVSKTELARSLNISLSTLKRHLQRNSGSFAQRFAYKKLLNEQEIVEVLEVMQYSEDSIKIYLGELRKAMFHIEKKTH